MVRGLRCSCFLISGIDLCSSFTDLLPKVIKLCPLHLAALCDLESDRLAVYYGAADTVTCLCYARLSELAAYVKENSQVF